MIILVLYMLLLVLKWCCQLVAATIIASAEPEKIPQRLGVAQHPFPRIWGTRYITDCQPLLRQLYVHSCSLLMRRKRYVFYRIVHLTCTLHRNHFFATFFVIFLCICFMRAWKIKVSVHCTFCSSQLSRSKQKWRRLFSGLFHLPQIQPSFTDLLWF